MKQCSVVAASYYATTILNVRMENWTSDSFELNDGTIWHVIVQGFSNNLDRKGACRLMGDDLSYMHDA